MTQEETAATVAEVLSHGLQGDAEASWAALMRLGTSLNANAMYGACCGFAEAGKAALKQMFAPAAFAGGPGMYALTQLQHGADPEDLWAARFVVAHTNGDQDTTQALYDTALTAGPERFVDAVGALVTTVVGLIITATGGGTG